MSYGIDSIDETCAALLPDCAAGWERQGSSGSREEGERGSGDKRACTVLTATRSVPLSVALPSHLCGETLRFAPQTVRTAEHRDHLHGKPLDEARIAPQGCRDN